MGEVYKGKSSRKRVLANLPVRVRINGKTELFWTAELSEWGLRMYLPQQCALESFVGQSQKLELDIVLDPNDEPAQVVVDLLWAVPNKAGQWVGSVLFRAYYQDARERLIAFVKESEQNWQVQSNLEGVA